MPLAKAIVDILFTDNGDMVLDEEEEDLADTSKIPLRGLGQELDTRVFSAKGDWILNSTVGANLHQYQGEPNNASTGLRIREAIENELLRGGFLKSIEFSVRTVPVDRDSILIFLIVKPIGSQHRYQQIYSYNLKDDKLARRR